MAEKYKILSTYIKDLSSETPNVESYLYTKDNISKYELDIDINSNPLKNKLIEVNTCLKFHDKTKQEKKSYFEVIYTSVVRIEDIVKEKFPTAIKVTIIAIAIPIIPKKFPCLEVSGDESPLRAKINKIPETK